MRLKVTVAALAMSVMLAGHSVLAAEPLPLQAQADQLERDGRIDQAIPIRRQLLDQTVRTSGPQSIYAALAHSFLAADLQYAAVIPKRATLDLNYIKEAEQHWRSAIEIYRKIEGHEGGVQTARLHMELATNLYIQRREADSKRESDLAMEIAKKLERAGKFEK